MSSRPSLLAAFKRALPVKRFAGSDLGTTATAFALALPALFAGVGVAVDFGIMHGKHAQLQQAADSAAIAAVKELTVATANEKSVAAAAESFAKASSGVDSLEVKSDVSKNRDAVTVTVKEEWTPFFAHFLKADVTPIVVSATARLAGETNLCVLTLEPKAAKGIHMDNDAIMVANGCGVYSNSVNSQGIRLDSGSKITASLVCSAGGVMAKGGATQPGATEDCAALADPLASRPAPAVGPCDENSLDLAAGDHVLKPGHYCNGLKISGDARVTFQEGNYVISGGKFEISGMARVKGEHVGFYLSGPQTTLQFTGNSTIEFKGAKEGNLAGLLFFEDRASPPNRQHRINSSNAAELTGTIYLSRGDLRIDPNSSVAAASDYTAIIVQSLQLYEGPQLVLNSNYSKSTVPVPEGIRMSEQVVLSR